MPPAFFSEKKYQRWMLTGMISLAVLIAVSWWLYHHFYLSTDDAYINANVIHISPRVTGMVSQLAVHNNEHIKAGQLLFSLDPAIFAAIVRQQEASVENASAQLEIAYLTAERTLRLVKQHAVSTQEGDIAKAALKSAQAKKMLAEALLMQAKLNLQYTNSYATDSGWITRLTLRAGDYVTEGESLFALVSDREFWVSANFRETELSGIRIGEPVKIVLDMYPFHPFHGKVESISSGSGAVFSLLPPENATGNWVKVVQRVPVRIRVLDPDPVYPLRIGTSVTVTLRRH